MAVKPLSNEAEILTKIAEGDQHAFTILFNHYQRDVFVHSKRLTQSEDRAVENVQNIFIKIWVGRDRLNNVANFGGYLNRSVRNHSFDLLKQVARENAMNLDFQKDHSETEDTTSQQVEYKEAINTLNEALSQLAPQQKMAYKLCHQDGMKYDEAALQMNISTETLKIHMKQALRKIRDHFRKNALTYPLLIMALNK
jgi:RNA polymerase sigma factor (sigma-70 family)